MFAVVISEKGGAERREVFEGTEVSVGRVRGNDLVLSKGNVSKRVFASTSSIASQRNGWCQS